jgi:uncharacterized protein
MQIKSKLISIRDLVVTAGPFVALVVLVFGLAYLVVDPTPPSTMVMASGPEGSDYDVFAKRYQKLLARHHIRVILKQTQGSRENLDLVKKTVGGVDAAFVRSATASRDELEQSTLESIGSLFYEPVWIFYREAVNLDSLTKLRGLNFNDGPQGSGTPRLAQALMRQNQVDPSEVHLSELENTDAVVALLEGKLDALLITSASDGLMIQMLLQTPGIKLFNFTQAEAYSRRLRSLSHVVLPRGVVNLAKDMPPQDIDMVSPTSSLVLRDGIHPALTELLVQAASEIHGRADWFARVHEFPSAQSSDYPVAKEALRFYRTGPPLLQRYLPFWLANLIERMWVVLLSMAALLIPLSRILPPLYEWRIRSRIYRWYAQLKAIEREVQIPASATPAPEAIRLHKQLDDLETKVNHINVPLSYTDEVFFLRQHIDLVRSKLGNAT